VSSGASIAFWPPGSFGDGVPAVDDDLAAVRDARFDLDHTRITAPFTGRIGTHEVSVGNLISGSRGGTSPTTLLATLVSTDSVYLNFDMQPLSNFRGESPGCALP
jgi:multidrug resistance efflux pump